MKANASRKQTQPEFAVGDRLPFGELAMLLGYISREELGTALRDQVLRNQKIGTILIQNGALTKPQAKEILRLQKRDGPIAGYKLKQRIGSGGMGTVYRALQKSLNREVAIKILNLESTRSDVQKKRFLQEAHLLAQLQHPNLVQCIDIGESEGLVYLVLEFVDGRNARERLNHLGPYPQDFAVNLLRQCLEAMSHYHEKAIIHRDIKPENILVSEDGSTKITDLGLSKQLTNDLSLTRVGKTVGTPYYISPELAKGSQDIDIRSDLYSLAATFYHLATGEPVFDGPSPPAILTAHVRDNPERPSKINPKLSRDFDVWLLKLLEKNPKRRFQTPDEALEALEMLASRGESPSSRRRSTTGLSGRATQARGPRSSGVRAGTRASGVRSARGSGNIRRSANRQNSNQSRRQGRVRLDGNGPKTWQLIVGLVIVIGLALATGYLLGRQSSAPTNNTPFGNNSQELFEAQRQLLVERFNQNPAEAISDMERWAEVTDRHDEVIKRWKLLQNRGIRTNLPRDFMDRIQDGIQTAEAALDQAAADALIALEAKVEKLIREGKFDAAQQEYDNYPKYYSTTGSWSAFKESQQDFIDKQRR